MKILPGTSGKVHTGKLMKILLHAVLKHLFILILSPGLGSNVVKLDRQIVNPFLKIMQQQTLVLEKCHLLEGRNVPCPCLLRCHFVEQTGGREKGVKDAAWCVICGKRKH